VDWIYIEVNVLDKSRQRHQDDKHKVVILYWLLLVRFQIENGVLKLISPLPTARETSL
jgi:hypothetical protein